MISFTEELKFAVKWHISDDSFNITKGAKEINFSWSRQIVEENIAIRATKKKYVKNILREILQIHGNK